MLEPFMPSEERFEYFEHGADVGIVGRGGSWEAAFKQAATAMFNLIVDVDKVSVQKTIPISCQASNREELFVEWLNTLLAVADLRRMVFSFFKIKKLGENRLEGEAGGEPFDPKVHNPKVEVKAATYSMLALGREGENYFARCVVDV